jgi:hypothetical protein
VTFLPVTNANANPAVISVVHTPPRRFVPYPVGTDLVAENRCDLRLNVRLSPRAVRSETTDPRTEVIVNGLPAPGSVNSPTIDVLVEQRSLPIVRTSTHTAGTPAGLAASPVIPAHT